jgi:hypothetical protein
VSRGGITVSMMAVRTSDQRKPTGPPPILITRMPSRRLPTVLPVSAVSMNSSTANTAMVQNCECVSQYAISMQSSQSMNRAPTRLIMVATEPGPCSGSPNL